jgi:hypothetical protein
MDFDVFIKVLRIIRAVVELMVKWAAWSENDAN